MRTRFATGFGRAVRQYSVALGFVLGQIAPLPTTPARERAAIVRTEPNERDALGFDPRERLSGKRILTLPHTLSGPDEQVPGLSDTRGYREPDWLRQN